MVKRPMKSGFVLRTKGRYIRKRLFHIDSLAQNWFKYIPLLCDTMDGVMNGKIGHLQSFFF